MAGPAPASLTFVRVENFVFAQVADEVQHLGRLRDPERRYSYDDLLAMLVIALIMAFSVYILYLGHAEEQAQKASVRMQENLSKLFSSKLPEARATTDLGRITPARHRHRARSLGSLRRLC